MAEAVDDRGAAGREQRQAEHIQAPGLAGFGVGSIRQPSTNATTPIGTLTKKIHDQCRFSRISPPTTGPRIGAIIAGIDTNPITLPIRWGPATWAMIIIATGMIIPPPAPWRMRKSTSEVIEWTARTAPTPVNSTSETM